MVGKSAKTNDILMRAIRKSRPFIFKTGKYLEEAMRTAFSGKLVRLKGESVMVKLKAGGIVLGGIAAYLILSKGLNVAGNCVRNICVAHEWKNYYKYGKEGNMVPPGYASHTRQINDKEEYVVESPEEQAAKQKQAKDNTSNKAAGAAVADAIVKAISDVFGWSKSEKEAVEGDSEASESTSEAEKVTDEKVKPIVELHPDRDNGDTDGDDVLGLDFSENPDGEFVTKDGNKV